MNNYWKNRKILITGGCGFIGSNAIDFFLKKGAIISATVSPNTSTARIEKKLGKNATKINLHKIDLLDKNKVIEIVDGIEIIMNFAAIDGGMKYKLENSQEIYQKNTSIAKILLEAAVKRKTKTFLLMSSSDIYPTNEINPLTEEKANNTKWNPNKDGYKFAKLNSEKYTLETANKFGLNTIIVRAANIYGPRDNFEDESKIRFIPSVLRKILLEKKPVVIWGDGLQIKSFLYIENFLDICASLIEKGVFNTPINVASKTPITLKGLAEKLITISKTDTQVITDPKKIVGHQQSMLDISLLEKKIGHINEINLDDGLKNTIKYFKTSIKSVPTKKTI